MLERSITQKYILFQIVDKLLVIRIGQRSATQRRSDDGCSLVFGNQLEDLPRRFAW